MTLNYFVSFTLHPPIVVRWEKCLYLAGKIKGKIDGKSKGLLMCASVNKKKCSLRKKKMFDAKMFASILLIFCVTENEHNSSFCCRKTFVTIKDKTL